MYMIFRGGRAIGGAKYGQGTGRIVLDDVGCRGGEASLLDCPKKGLGKHNCGHTEDASVDCQTTVSSTPANIKALPTGILALWFPILIKKTPKKQQIRHERVMLKLTYHHINRRDICFNIKSIPVNPLLWIYVMLDFICMVFAELSSTGYKRKIQNNNVCLRRESNQRPLAFQRVPLSMRLSGLLTTNKTIWPGVNGRLA